MDLRGKILIPAVIVLILAIGFLYYQKRQTSSAPVVAQSTSTPTSAATATPTTSASPTATSAATAITPTADVDAAVNAFIQEGADINNQSATSDSTTDPGTATNVDQAISAE